VHAEGSKHGDIALERGGEVNGTWTTKPPPKTVQTVLGALLIVVIVLLGLASQNANGASTGQAHVRAATPSPAPSQSPSPRR
jgi:hypothetical protein